MAMTRAMTDPVAVAARKARLKFEAGEALRKKLEVAGADMESVLRELDRLAEALREEKR